MQGATGLKFITLAPGCGYGDAGTQYIAGLHALGVPITWIPTIAGSEKDLSVANASEGLQDSIREDLIALLRRPMDCSAILVNIPPFEFQTYWRQAEPELRPFTYIAWELEQVPEDWLPALDLYERVFVPSTFNQSALVAAGVKASVEVVPHIARTVTPIHRGVAWGTVTDEDFVFYTIGTWTTRKAMEETIRAYLDAFDDGDKVALIVKTEAIDHIALNGKTKRDLERAPSHFGTVWWALAQILSGYSNPAKVHLIAESLSPREIDRLHTRGDCLISLTRSEGWGLGPFDAALFGNPVVVTGWSGHLDYLGDDYPLLVRYELEETAKSPPDGYYLRSKDAFWAHADRHHASELMRFVFENQDRAKDIARDAQSRIQTDYAAGPVCRRFAGSMGFEVKA